jgi:hypothetical protein
MGRTGTEAPRGASMKPSLAELIRDIEDDDLVDVCGALRLDAGETASVLARHRQSPELLGLVLALGGNLADFVEARVEIRRGLRASG